MISYCTPEDVYLVAPELKAGLRNRTGASGGDSPDAGKLNRYIENSSREVRAALHQRYDVSTYIDPYITRLPTVRDYTALKAAVHAYRSMAAIVTENSQDRASGYKSEIEQIERMIRNAALRYDDTGELVPARAIGSRSTPTPLSEVFPDGPRTGYRPWPFVS